MTAISQSSEEIVVVPAASAYMLQSMKVLMV